MVWLDYIGNKNELNELQSLKSSSLFGESLRVMSKSSLKATKTNNSPLVTKCEIGDSLVSIKKKYRAIYVMQ